MNMKNNAKLLVLLRILCLLFVIAQPSFSQDAASLASAARVQGIAVTPEQVSAYAKPGEVDTTEQTPDELAELELNDPNALEVEDIVPDESLSTIELLMSGQAPKEVSKDLRQFGYDVFSRQVSTFAPITNVPVGADYIVGPGDSFTVTMWGRHNDRSTVVVDREGKIALPEVGVLNVSGMPFGKLQDYLESELKRKFTDFRMHIAMGRLRTITVYTIGEARAPGSYTLSSLSTVINALFAAGGPSKNGTLRNIRVLRSGAEPRTVDLYDFLMGGDKQGDVRLQDGDTIHIPLIGSVVAIAGNVKRPAIYEMKGQMSLGDVLDLAGGVNYASWLQRVQVERVANHSKRIVVDFDLSDQQPYTENLKLKTVIQDGDVIKVFSVTDSEQNAVYLEGHVGRPGKYELKPGMRLSDLLGEDVFLPQVNMEYAEIIRFVPPDLHPETTSFNLGELLEGDAGQDLELAQFDRIRLFRWDEKGKKSVSVEGLVYEPGEYRFREGMQLKDLIGAAGGLQEEAYLPSAELTRRYIDRVGMNMEQINIDLEKALSGDPAHNIALRDYDRLVVYALPELVAPRYSVSVSGLVYEPNEYRLFEGMRVSDLINFAGGLQENAYLVRAELTRRNISQVGMVSETINIDLGKAIEGDPEENVRLKDHDFLVVRSIPELEYDRTVTIRGQVRFPGTYPISKGESLSSLLDRAGGYTEKAYLRGAVFTRESAKSVQQARVDEMIRQLELSLLTSSSGQMSETMDSGARAGEAAQGALTLTTQQQLITKLQAAPIDGRVVVRLLPLDEFSGTQYDLEMEDGDVLNIEQRPGTVNIVGEVFNPVSLVYEEGLTVEDCLARVGGVTKEADEKQISVIRVDGSVISTAQKKSQRVAWGTNQRKWHFGGFMDAEIGPGDTIVVPRHLDKINWMQETKDITQILFQIAVAAGVVLAL